VARWQCLKSRESIRTILDSESSRWKASRIAKQASCIERQHSGTSRGTRHESGAPQLAVSLVYFLLLFVNTEFAKTFLGLLLNNKI
jgi:hypothetical protein